MPKSKRAKVVHLSKTEKKGKELNLQLAEKIKEAADQYKYIFVFSVNHMRNTYLKDVRAEFSDSRIFFGKTKVMAIALGLTPETEHLPNLRHLTKHITGDKGLLLTSRPPAAVLAHFAAYAETDYARAGVRATHTFTVPAGTVCSRGGELAPEDDVPLPHSLEPMLRKWGMPTRLVKGRVTLNEPYTVCVRGKVLNSYQTALLKTFGVAMAEFRVRVRAYYSTETQEVTEVESAGEGEGDDGDDNDDEMQGVDDDEEVDEFDVPGVAKVVTLDDLEEKKEKKQKTKTKKAQYKDI
ncbi:hypothetical protein EJ05DRAFT_506380 [Pseudovirgaria hyperparasitica]|uniref:Ribosome assembly factor mrt4 n=1 Tax=Pseudovirgaria hyperparasitica TaxID=470096 RepID=A0A6A6WKG5_9PEZI|nr:uncharacterized protein EJ05DRAFT_506380 [Pseudovirgaria hyperparasitica]KAF2762685.1 hypothetical protein EJ05DRAFT_506380 [Pseudovirgaria hyperparasitica]